ncbi:uncharacterized protein LOC127858968 isoform X2 [Dreissena polymorpha]|uniref:uncharacterized protein LOC127858968 isoform X1 n=1 Tax=Dreissena polymorpha TaxID=45954 RepID=UPI00226498B9|nr:uncharacterized protein LOC127858968 isoform X1 [Dreissena polymorpha]XP_052252311.1 uncharacterized protein LOC127858968 isoform X2 [Dreissena polymorpha]
MQRNNAVSQILRTSKYLAAITMGFFVAVTPWTLCTLVVSLSDVTLNADLDFVVTWVAISNSFWNVVIYCVMNRKFRQAAVSLTGKGRRREISFPERILGCRLDSNSMSIDVNPTAPCGLSHSVLTPQTTQNYLGMRAHQFDSELRELVSSSETS